MIIVVNVERCWSACPLPVPFPWGLQRTRFSGPLIDQRDLMEQLGQWIPGELAVKAVRGRCRRTRGEAAAP